MIAPFGAKSQVSFGEIVAGFTCDSAQRALTSQPEPTPAASQVAQPAPKSTLHGQRNTDVWNSFRVQGCFCPRLMCRSLSSEIATKSTRTSFRAESNCPCPNSTRRTPSTGHRLVSGSCMIQLQNSTKPSFAPGSERDRDEPPAEI
jgi:hypothetical protein